MFYTRRKILRDTAATCLASAFSTLSIAGCRSNRQSVPATDGLPAKAQTVGIAVFFIGSWIFAADPDSPQSRILALTMDVNHPKHHFPFGVYGPNFDNLPDLPITGSSKKHEVKVDHFGTLTPADLLKQTVSQQAFLYIPNFAVKIKQSAESTLRRISIPVPETIETTSFLSGSRIDDKDGVVTPNPNASKGNPTAFVFHYPNATLLETDFDSTHLAGGSKAYYQFRVVPQDTDHCPDHGHAKYVFDQFFKQMIDCKGKIAPQLNVDCVSGIVYDDNTFLADELDVYQLPADCKRCSSGNQIATSLRTGSCGAGGIAVGG